MSCPPQDLPIVGVVKKKSDPVYVCNFEDIGTAVGSSTVTSSVFPAANSSNTTDTFFVEGVYDPDTDTWSYTRVDTGAPLAVGDFVVVDSVSIQPADNLAVDAFGRQRVSETVSRFEFEFQADLLPLEMDTVLNGTGSAAVNATERSVHLDTGGVGNGASALVASNYYIPYTKGSSQKIAITGAFNPSGTDFTNTRVEARYGDAQNAIGFYYEAGVAGVFLRNNGVNNDIPQSSWDNPLTGLVDWTNSQIFAMDFQSLRVGRIRFGLSRNGVDVAVHEIVNDNIRAAGYWQTPNLPLAWSIENIGVANNSNETLVMCGSVKSEGGEPLLELPGSGFGVDTGATPVTISTTEIPLLAIKPAATFKGIENRIFSILENINVFSSDEDWIARFYILDSGDLTGASFVAVDPESSVEYDISSTAFANARPVIAPLPVPGSNNTSATASKVVRRPFALGYDGNQPAFLVTGQRIGTVNASGIVCVGWRESK